MVGSTAGIRGVVTCKSVWSCPVCAASILRARREDVRRVVAWARDQGYHLALVTVTVRHGLGDDVGALVHAIADAWRACWGGRQHAERSASWGLVGAVRRIEATHGEHGWHPHAHALVVTRRPLTPADRDELARTWARAVDARLGREHVPSWERGVVLGGVDREGRYLSKMALELAADITKEARHGGRSPWAVAASDAPADRAAWLAWVDGTRGVGLLTWTTGARDLRKLARVAAVSEAEAVEPEAVEMLRIDRPAWYVVRRQPGAVVSLLDAAERGGREELERVLASVLRRAGYDPPTADRDAA